MPTEKSQPTNSRYEDNTVKTNGNSAPQSSKSLMRTHKQRAGRSTKGNITVRRRGGGAKRRYRVIDFDLEPGTTATVESIDYDPNRSSHIALIKKADGSYAYIPAGTRMQVGDRIDAGEDAEIKPGNRIPLARIPLGSTVYNVELTEGKGGQLVRSAGAGAKVTSKEGGYVFVRLPSSEVRLIHQRCYATLGRVGNEQHQNVRIGSAGRNRRRGKRPSVRGKAMNPTDHPMGGGEGLSSPGRLPRTPWGKQAVGKKTRRRKRGSNAIVRQRSKKRRK